MSEDAQLRRALSAIQALRSKVERLEGSGREPIAVVGLGCRYPGGGDDPDSFWQALETGVDAISEVPRDRWDVERYFDPDPDKAGRMYSRYGGFLDRVDGFDAEFFDILPREALELDPQQRLALEVTWEALEDAGCAPDGLRGSQTGVMMGVTLNEYDDLLRSRGLESIAPHHMSGVCPGFIAGRLSYNLGLHGPSMVVDTACSSSLVAVHLAVRSLRSGECDMALAGGVSLMLWPEWTVIACRMRMLSPDGRCKTFDAAADGFVRGEGCGVVVLKRLSDALAAGDRIRAVIRGSAVNSDGPSSGMTVPSGTAQEAMLRRALEDAGVGAERVDYVEAHGTGTSLGDPIEIEALGNVIGRAEGRTDALVVGSVKTNVGHLEAAAGVVGLTKAILSLEHGVIPPHLHFERPNPHISFEESNVRVPTELTPWPRGEQPRIAGVSAFGASGTNAHLILEEAPEQPSEGFPERACELMVLSARSEPALLDLAGRYVDHLRSPDAPALGDIGLTSALGRARFDERLAVWGSSPTDVADRLEAFVSAGSAPGLSRGRVASAGRSSARRLAFVFSGQGAQYAGMGRELFEHQPVFRQALELCDEVFRLLRGESLLPVLFETGEAAETRLASTELTQPALFAFEFALARLWDSWGVTPDVVLGHSVGEYVAACVAGCFSPEDGLRLIAERARLMGSLPAGGAMAAVFATVAEVRSALEGWQERLSIAAINGPRSVVVSGDEDALTEWLDSASDFKTRRLRVSHAFHSHRMEPILDDLSSAVEAVRFSPPEIPLIANLSGELVGPDTLADPRYWVRHAREAVQFEASVEQLREQAVDAVVEIGPGTTLLSLGQSVWEDPDVVWVASARRGRDETAEMTGALGQLWTVGVEPAWQGVFGERSRPWVSLPTYPWQHSRFWPDDADTSSPLAPAREGSDVTRLLDDGDVAGLVSAVAQEVTLPDELQQRLPEALEALVARHRAEAGPDLLSDSLYELEWVEQPPAGTGSGTPGSWLVLAKSAEQAAALEAALATDSRNRTAVLFPGASSMADALREVWEGQGPFDRVVDLRHLGEDDSELTAAALLESYEQTVEGVLELLRAISDLGGSGASQLLLVSAGLGPDAADAASLLRAPLRALVRALDLELPDWGALVDVESGLSPAALAAQLTPTLGLAPSESLIALRGDSVWVPRLRRAPRIGERVDIKSSASYLVTGGFGALGLEVADWLAGAGARHVVLVGRSGAGDEALDRVESLRRAGVDVTEVQADVAAIDEARELFDRIASLPPLGGIVHCAGVLNDGALLTQNWQEFLPVLRPKVLGGWNLHQLSSSMALDFFVMFSSAASMLGSPGQGSYAVANAFLDGLAGYRRTLGLPAVAINWGPWAGKGMAARTVREGGRRAPGVRPLHPEAAVAALGRLLAHPEPAVGVLDMDWPSFLEGPAGSLPVLRGLAEAGQDETADEDGRPEGDDVLAGLNLATPAERRQRVLETVRRELAGIMGVAHGELPDAEATIFDLGVDSLMTFELRNRLQKVFDLQLSTTLVLDHPTMADLAEFLVSCLAESDDSDLAPDPQPSAAESREEEASSDDGPTALGRLKRLVLRPLQRAPQSETPAVLPGEVPLTPGQTALWYIDQTSEETTAYHFVARMDIVAGFDEAAFRIAFDALIRRHPMLRARFLSQRGTLVQRIEEDEVSELVLIDGSAWTEDQFEKQLKELVRRPIDLEEGPIYRVRLIRRPGERLVFLFVVHHIAFDGLSAEVFLRHLGEFYAAAQAGDTAPSSAAATQYADYVDWQRDFLESEEGLRQLAYWDGQLASSPPFLDLPTDKPRPLLPRLRGGSVRFEFPPDLTARLQALAAGESATLFSALVALVQSLLFRHSGQQDISIGTLVAARTRPEFSDVVGYFVNPIVLRSIVRPELSFRQFLNQVALTVTDGLKAQEVPYPLLVDRLKPARTAGRNPLFQIALDFERRARMGEVIERAGEGDRIRIDLGELQMESEVYPQQEGQFELAFDLKEVGDHLIGDLKFNSDLYEQATAERLAAQLLELARSAVEKPEETVGRLGLLPADERHRLDEWNGSSRSYQRELSLGAMVDLQAAESPDRTAVRFAGESISFAELERRSSTCARRLAAGAGQGSLIGIYLERSIDMVVALLAVLKAGCAFVPLDPSFPRRRLELMMSGAEIDTVITQDLLRDSMPGEPETVLTVDALQRQSGEESESIEVDPESLAYVIFTSGSTGRPKGVQVSHRAVVNFLSSMRAEPGIEPDDALLSVTTLSFDISILEIFLPLIAGATLVLAEDAVVKDGRELARLLVDSGATIAQATPTTWRLLLEAGWEGHSEFKILCGGEAWEWELAERLLPCCGSLWNMYGPTETTIWSAVRRVRAGDGEVRIGLPIANTQLLVLDERLEVVPIGVPGELFIGGDGLAEGYIGQPELTAERFLANPFEADRTSRIYRTGDRVRRLADGTMQFQGRLDNQIKLRGYRIELGEIEACLSDLPGVSRALAMVRDEGPGEPRLAGYLEMPEGESIDLEEARAFAKARLPVYMVPTAWFTLQSFPLTLNGKVDRKALPSLTSVAEPTEQVALTGVEARLRSIWQEVLGGVAIDLQSNFFDLGGSSLMALQLSERIRSGTGVELPVAVFINNNLGQIASKVRQKTGESSTAGSTTQ